MRATALDTLSVHSRAQTSGLPDVRYIKCASRLKPTCGGNPALGPRFRGDERRVPKPGHDKSGVRCYLSLMLRIETEREDDGRWLAEVPALPGVLSYGAADAEARSKATALALRVIAERVENGEAHQASQ